jgi:hypothetical protein
VDIDNKNIKSRNAGVVLIPADSADGKLRSTLNLSRIASRVWYLIGEKQTLAEIAALIAGEFGLDKATAIAETRELVGSFQAGNTMVVSKIPTF